MANEILNIPVIRVTQQGKTLYIGKMLAKDMLAKCITTEWDPSKGWDLNEQGYQRAPNEKHYKSIANFLRIEQDPLLPTSALVSAREDQYGSLQFTPQSEQQPDCGTLTIPPSRLLFIVDYQHRWRGIKYAVEQLGSDALLNFQVPVIIMADVSRYEEIRQFYLINSKQKRIDTDLGLALLQTMAGHAHQDELVNFVGQGHKYRIRATRLTFQVAGMAEGPWVGKIMDPNMVSSGNQIISIKSFTDSLRPLIIRSSPVKDLDDPQFIHILNEYWKGIKEVIPTAFAEPKIFAIQKPIGAYVFHQVAARKVFKLCESSNDYSSSYVASILIEAQSEYINPSYWQIGGPIKNFSSASGMKSLAEMIIAALD